MVDRQSSFPLLCSYVQIKMSCNLAEHGLLNGVTSVKLQAVFTVENNSEKISYTIAPNEVLYYYANVGVQS